MIWKTTCPMRLTFWQIIHWYFGEHMQILYQQLMNQPKMLILCHLICGKSCGKISVGKL